MPNQPYNPVEVLLKEKHQHEVIWVGRLIDLSGTQYRFITESQRLKEGKRYDIDYQLLEKNLIWIKRPWEAEIYPRDNDWR